MHIKDYPLDSRPYEKFQKYGPMALTDAELLAILLRTGTREYSAVELAYQLIGQSEGHSSKQLLKLFKYTSESLQKIKGIGQVKATQILSLLELSKRLAEQQYEKSIPLIQPSQIVPLFMERLRHKREEHFVVAYLDTKLKLIESDIISKGSLNATIVHPREVYKGAFLHSAHSIIVLHNHPSGDPTPSKEDLEVTNRLRECGKIVGINLLDHIIIGDRKYTSLKEEGYI